MTKGAKIGIIVGVVIVLLLCCCVTGGLGWYFGLGPGSYQTAAAKKLIDSANSKYSTVLASSEKMNNSASSLGTDLSKDTSTASIQTFKDEVTKLESQAQEDIDQLDNADKDIASAETLRLPEWEKTYLNTLSRRDVAARAGLESLMQAFAVSRKMVGSLSYVIDGVDGLTNGFASIEQITTAMGSGDFAGAQAKISEADASLAAAETALKTANETINSQDINNMITVSVKFREVLPLMRSLLQAAQAQDTTTMASVQNQLTAKLAEASKAAEAAGATGDFSNWFDKSIKKYEDESAAKFAEADRLQKQAIALYSANN
jgi:hypothetical protein